MLNQPLSLKLLAPTVLVSLVLVVACLFGALYLNHLTINISAVLSENVQSTRVATRLEATAKDLTRLLRQPEPPQGKIAELNQELREVLREANQVANLENEMVLVDRIRNGLRAYLRLWNEQTGAGQNEETYENLAEHLEKQVLKPCAELRAYNTTQIENSDRDNKAIVQKLKWGLIAFGVGGPLSGLLLGYAIARGLHHSIYQLSVRIRDAAGRLNRELGSVTVNEESDLPALQRQMQGVIVEIERVVEQLQQREREVLRAEQLAAVGQVAAGVAHELRNPLTSIKMLVQTGLEGQPASGLPAEDLTIIETEIRRMEQCIKLFLDFARPPRSERRPTNLNDVVRRALALVEGRARKQQVVFSSVLPPEPILRCIDAEQIHQVLLNLLLNALDALPRGGIVRVVMEPKEPAGVEVRVQDNGPGIAPQIYGRLFEPFVSSRETGLGLGLSICKRLIEGHGGVIHGDNASEGGAVFTFTLPE